MWPNCGGVKQFYNFRDKSNESWAEENKNIQGGKKNGGINAMDPDHELGLKYKCDVITFWGYVKYRHVKIIVTLIVWGGGG